MDREWIWNARRQEANPFGWRSTAAAKREHSRAAFATRTSSYVGFCELDRGGRTVGKRLRVRWPGADGDGFGIALEQCVGAGVGAQGHRSRCDRERGTTAALLETRETSQRVMRVVLGRYSACRVTGSGFVLTGVCGCGCGCRSRRGAHLRRAHFHGVHVPSGMTKGTM
jgi:hypothetical protein